MKIENYTAYSTEDLRALWDAVVHLTGEMSDLAAPPCVRMLAIVYWQGRRLQPERNVRPGVVYSKEWGGHVLRIKRPDRLNLSPLEMLAMQSANPQLPAEVVQEMAQAFLRRLSRVEVFVRVAAKGLPPVHIMDAPDLVESAEDKRRRVGEKKVRKAVKAATSLGLRMGPSLTQLRDKIDRLEAIKDLLGPKEKALLAALRAQHDTMAAVEAATSVLRGEDQ
jgi:hypothetical protein